MLPQYFYLLFWTIPISLAQTFPIPPKLLANGGNDFFSLADYLPINISATYFKTDNDTRSIIGSNSTKTLVIPLDLAFTQFVSELSSTPDGPAKTELLSDFNNPNLTDQVLHDAILKGTFNFTSLNASTYPNKSIFVDTSSNIPIPVINIYQASSALYVRSGANFSSRIVVTDIPFNSGIVHLLEYPLSPILNASATGIVVNITFLTELEQVSFGADVQDPTNNVTIFALDNNAVAALSQSQSGPTNGTGSGSVSGSRSLNSSTFNYGDYYYTNTTVGYSIFLENGFKHTTQSNRTLETIANSSGIFVNGARITSPDILIENGVVHLIDRPLAF